MKRRYLLKNTTIHLHVPPLGTLGCSGAPGLSHCNRVNKLSTRGCRVAVVGEVMLFLKEKKVQRPE